MRVWQEGQSAHKLMRRAVGRERGEGAVEMMDGAELEGDANECERLCRSAVMMGPNGGTSLGRFPARHVE